MRALLLQARSPRTYWSFERSLPFIGKAAILPPLGLATLAAHLPDRWGAAPPGPERRAELEGGERRAAASA